MVKKEQKEDQSMDEVYDVIIVGAGPAGGTAAYFLGQAGKRVLVLEKKQLPRYKACGGGVSLPFLKKTFPFDLEPVLESRIEEICYSYKKMQVTVPTRQDQIAMVMRDQFDAEILKQSGAEVITGAVSDVQEEAERVIVHLKDGRSFEAQVLIGADGANSIVAKCLGLRKKKSLAAAIEAEVTVSPQVMDWYHNQTVFIFGEIRNGYAWIFPKKDHLSVGIAALKPKKGKLKQVLKKVMGNYGINVRDEDLRGHPIPFYRMGDQIQTKRCLLVGDAGGLVDPLSGEGIRWAIKSGKMAAEKIIEGDLEGYQPLIRKKIGRNHLFSLAVARFYYLFEPLCLLFGAPNPFVTQAIEDLMADKAATAEIMLVGILTLPYFLLVEIWAGIESLFKGEDAGEKVRRKIYFNE